MNPHGNADETGSVTKTTAKSYANIYIQNASGFATNNRVIARVHKASDRSTATEINTYHKVWILLYGD